MAVVARSAPIAQPWFSTPFFDKMLADSTLSNSERAEICQFADLGYLIFDPEIEDIDGVADELTRNVPYPIHDGKAFNCVQDHWRHNEAVRALATLPSVMAKLQFLYQRTPVPFQTLNFPVGTEQATHSDTIHFNSIPERWMCGVWIALEDIDEFNGPLHYYEGSHRLPVFNMHDFGLSPQDYSDLSQSYPIYERVVADMLAAGAYKRVEVKMKKGQALIWEANLFHGGSAILDYERTRLSQVTHYYFEGCSYYGPLQSDVPLGKMVWRHVENIATGKPVVHKYNGITVNAPMFDGPGRMLSLQEDAA